MVNGVTAQSTISSGLSRTLNNLQETSRKVADKSAAGELSGLVSDTVELNKQSVQINAMSESLETVESVQKQLARIPLETQQSVQSMSDLKGQAVDTKA